MTAEEMAAAAESRGRAARARAVKARAHAGRDRDRGSEDHVAMHERRPSCTKTRQGARTSRRGSIATAPPLATSSRGEARHRVPQHRLNLRIRPPWSSCSAHGALRPRRAGCDVRPPTGARTPRACGRALRLPATSTLAMHSCVAGTGSGCASAWRPCPPSRRRRARHARRWSQSLAWSASSATSVSPLACMNPARSALG
jgi:hypothetical protein